MKYSSLVNFLSVNLPLLCSSASFRNISHEQPVDISALLKSFEVLSTWHVTRSWHIRDIRLAMIAACVLTTGASRCPWAWRCTSSPCRRSVRSSWTSHSTCTSGERVKCECMYLASASLPPPSLFFFYIFCRLYFAWYTYFEKGALE